MSNLAETLIEDAGRIDEALRLNEETLKLAKAKLGPDHLDTLDVDGQPGRSCIATPDGSTRPFSLLKKCSNSGRPNWDRTHPDTLGSMMNLEIAYQGAGRFDEAIKLGEEALKLG